MLFFQLLGILILALPTYILWILFAIHFKILGRLCGIGRKWTFLKIYVKDYYIGH